MVELGRLEYSARAVGGFRVHWLGDLHVHGARDGAFIEIRTCTGTLVTRNILRFYEACSVCIATWVCNIITSCAALQNCCMTTLGGRGVSRRLPVIHDAKPQTCAIS